ncbi:extracellular solute-binding protein [Paracoccus tegillarcae]|uniref:ABC transporter substrate-binding protein n=1 Tax=Paracoccus tegillarcae TaxID=1529068 RepID=A0A2K9F1G1_9RHOB|nr:extracellular solute-binding protein [Paracoccus tegillarcae]AUH35404.1 ABC transporter substrate-binding protein [Paracoccus tegillarcae]
MKKLLISSVAMSGLMASGALAAEKVVVVTSFPEEMTSVIETAFEGAHPEYDLEILNKSTSSGVKYVQEIASANTADIFWASAPDAFEVLKSDDKLAQITPNVAGIPDMIGAYPMNDDEGYYFGFAASGYGIMWNTRYLEGNGLEPAKEWVDLEKPEYHGHVGMSAPSRSGTTHLTVETVLQGEGWDQGWADWKLMGGNFASVTERSFGVPDGVNTGSFGLGIVIDFFAFSSKASGFPVEFSYPKVTALVPANIGVIANAPNEAGATTFVEYLLSTDGQKLLFDPAIMRLPVNPEVYAEAPEGLPNPFEDSSIGAEVKFDVDTSGARYYVVSSLFDVMITYRLDDLKAAVKALQDAEAKHADGSNAEAKALIDEARALIVAVPITEEQSLDPAFNAAFTGVRKEAGDEIEARQAEIEQQWDATVTENYRNAKELAEKAAAM